MQHFKLIQLGINTHPMLEELNAIAHLHSSRAAVVDGDAPRFILSQTQDDPQLGGKVARFTPLSKRLPLTVDFLTQFGLEQGMSIRSAQICCRPPGYQQQQHQEPAEGAKWYQLVLHSPRGSYIRCAEEEVRMRPGELWLCAQGVLCAEANDTCEPCIHLEFQLQPRVMLEEPCLWREPLRAAQGC